jgi:hypothetical protein
MVTEITWLGTVVIICGVVLWLTTRRRLFQPGAVVSEEQITNTPRVRQNRTLAFVILWVATVAGMMTVEVYRHLKLGTSVSSSAMLVAAIVSPLVVRATLGDSTEQLRRPWYAIALAGYQAGFVWQTVVSQSLPTA